MIADPTRRSLGIALAVLGGVGFLLLVFAGAALETFRSPVPRWWWLGLWRVYLGCLVGGGALAILLGPGPRRDPELWLLPDARSRAFLDHLRQTGLGALVAVGLPGISWAVAIGAGAPVRLEAVLWAHALVLTQILGLSAWRVVAVWAGGRAGLVTVASVYAALGLATFLDLLWVRLPETTAVPAAILSSPLLSVYTAAGEDILRSSFWYGATHLGSWRFDYPAPVWTLGPPLVAGATAWLITRWRGHRWIPSLPEALEAPS